MNTQKFLAAASLMALSLSSAAALAAETGHGAGEGQEKCYGVAKAGKNDCGSSDGSHGCAGAAKEDGMATEWIAVPAGLCEKLAGGSLEAPKAD